MGMCAKCNGVLYVKMDCVDFVKDALDSSWLPDYDTTENASENMCIFNLWYSDGYSDLTVKSFLEKIKPYIYGGELEYVGDCYEMWRFDFRNGNWYEDEGYVAYTKSKHPI